jgi:excisionase family DNA binding protein
MKNELVGNEAVARALKVSGETIRYQARHGRIPFEVTPGGHRRFRISAVKEALGMPEPEMGAEMTSITMNIDLSEPQREMSEESRAWFAMSAGRDETALIHDHEKLSPSAPLAAFVKEATTRYAPARTFAGAGLAAH